MGCKIGPSDEGMNGGRLDDAEIMNTRVDWMDKLVYIPMEKTLKLLPLLVISRYNGLK